MQIAWSELVDALAEILLEDALNGVADKGLRVSRAALQTAARTRAAELVKTEIIPTTNRIIQQLTLSAIDGNADAVELRERILKSPAFSKARAVMLARIALDGKRGA